MSISILQAVLALAQFSPNVANWISGSKSCSKIDKVSKKIIDIAKNVTNSKNEIEAVEKIKSDKNIYLMFQMELIKSEKEIDLASIKDKENARNRDISIINAGKRNRRADIMVIAAAIGLISCLGVIVVYNHKLPGEAIGIISTIAGIFGACLKDAYNFEFGSSRGSKEKDQTVASILNSKSIKQ